MEDFNTPPLLFVVIPSDRVRLDGDRGSLYRSLDREQSLDRAMGAESSFVCSEMSDRSEIIPLVVLPHLLSSSSSVVDGETQGPTSRESTERGACDLQEECDNDSLYTLSTKDSYLSWKDHEKECTDVTMESQKQHTRAQSADEGSAHNNTTTTTTTTPFEAFESGDESYFTEGFVNVGELPIVC